MSNTWEARLAWLHSFMGMMQKDLSVDISSKGKEVRLVKRGGKKNKKKHPPQKKQKKPQTKTKTDKNITK